MTEEVGSPQPGWYDDGSGSARWWDGQNWGAFQAPSDPPTKRSGRTLAIAATAAFSLVIGTGLGVGAWALFFRDPLQGTYVAAVDAIENMDCEAFATTLSNDLRDELDLDSRRQIRQCQEGLDYLSDYYDIDLSRISEDAGFQYEVLDSEHHGVTGRLTIKQSISPSKAVDSYQDQIDSFIDDEFYFSDPKDVAYAVVGLLSAIDLVGVSVTFEMVKEDGEWKIDGVDTSNWINPDF